MAQPDNFVTFREMDVVRTLAIWYDTDETVAVQVPNPS